MAAIGLAFLIDQPSSEEWDALNTNWVSSDKYAAALYNGVQTVSGKDIETYKGFSYSAVPKKKGHNDFERYDNGIAKYSVEVSPSNYRGAQMGKDAVRLYTLTQPGVDASKNHQENPISVLDKINIMFLRGALTLQVPPTTVMIFDSSALFLLFAIIYSAFF